MDTKLRGFDILPERAQEWDDDEIEGYLYTLEQQGRQSGRARAIQLLAEQGRGPEAPAKRSHHKKKEEEEEEAE